MGDPSVLRGLSRLQASRLDVNTLAGMCEDPDEVMGIIELQLEKQKLKMEKAHMIDIKNIKKVLAHESIDFVKKGALSVEKQLTREH